MKTNRIWYSYTCFSYTILMCSKIQSDVPSTMAATADDDDYEVIYAVFRTNTLTVSHELFTVPL